MPRPIHLPTGMVDMIDAEQIAEASSQTILTAVKRGELVGYQSAKGQPWAFRPADLEGWKELRKEFHRFVPDGSLETSGRT